MESTASLDVSASMESAACLDVLSVFMESTSASVESTAPLDVSTSMESAACLEFLSNFMETTAASMESTASLDVSACMESAACLVFFGSLHGVDVGLHGIDGPLECVTLHGIGGLLGFCVSLHG